MDDWITTRQGAELTGYSVQHIRELVTTGAVKGQRWGRDWQVSRRSLLAYQKRAEQAGEKRGPKTGV